ncbi:putative eukaryotic translation initiation factor eIF1/SUI1 [Wolfiporia cocos MD-104 SS10]|uniref:Putative eukaryotic translation initiation factor eIF1/SUI1 n=1 Tax=Wolfiporia cocos (strain MD-104) TaxID=742152 RepID=A0A2H3JM73_WOLCO|nr:putative eukaryotic translation initiation factor eIF1/SUI1 [Wolfiporia cocos MD-104 SS10]
MIPGVVQHSPWLAEGQLVTITQYYREHIGAPLAVGRAAVSGDALRRAEERDTKGKAVFVLHTWKDAMWSMGINKDADVPAPQPWPQEKAEGDENEGEGGSVGGEGGEDEGNVEEVNAQKDEGKQEGEARVGEETQIADASPKQGAAEQNKPAALTAEDVSARLHAALLQALRTTLASLPPSAFPMPASTFWSVHVLPARPAEIDVDPRQVDVKHSTHRSVKAFLKAHAKEGLLKLKDTKGGDIAVAAVFPDHEQVTTHTPHRTVQDIEAHAQKKEEHERKAREEEEKRKGEVQITELWKPFGTSLGWFQEMKHNTSTLYTLQDVKEAMKAYIAEKGLMNAQEQQYIDVGRDPALRAAIAQKQSPDVEFLRREELLSRLLDHMQRWYEIRVEGKDAIRKKGQLKPIQVVVKIRQGRKACTLLTGFEPYMLDAEELAEELRKICASSTSVSPVQGKASEMEVMVQGKQIKAVSDLLIAKGVPKRWIESADLSAEKKKKK